MIIFSYPQSPYAPNLSPKTLSVRLNPISVDWTYTLNTQTYNTYGGQVIQILSININSLTITGQFGKEGPFGVQKSSTGGTDPRWGNQVPPGGYITQDITHQTDYEGQRYPGLYAMAMFFKEYFSVVAEGGDPDERGRFTQAPMVITYTPAVKGDQNLVPAGAPYSSTKGQTSRWIVTPNNFPQFSRSIGSDSQPDFAPMWSIECSVIEAPRGLKTVTTQAAVERLQSLINPGINPLDDPFSDPAADPLGSVGDVTQYIQSALRTILPSTSGGDVLNSIYQNISVANVPSQYGIPPTTAGLIDPNATTASTGTVGS